MTQMITSFTGEHEFLSNFYEHPFMLPALPGTWFNTAEHAFQAAKAMSGVDWARIVNARTPYQAKKAGRAVDCRPDWDHIKRFVMLEVLMAKFGGGGGGNTLTSLLAATDPAVLVEGNQWGDTYWGAVNIDHPKFNIHKLPVWQSDDDHGGIAGQPFRDAVLLTGHNWLGRILMMVREVL